MGSFATKLGQLVRQRRRANGMSQEELALLAGVGRRFVSELERGKASVRIETVDQVLRVFGKKLGVVNRERDE